MPTFGKPWLGLNHLHLLGKLLEVMNSEMMAAEGFSDYEIVKAERLFEALDEYLSQEIDLNWHDVEALV